MAVLTACIGGGRLPPEMTPILVMKFMEGWTPDDLASCPALLYDDIVVLMNKEAEAQKQLAKMR